ncbi:MAG: NYN domain-containing protein, partial [Candidatus Ratteibacteria bacterium]
LNVIKTSFIKKYESVSIESAKKFLIDIIERYKRKHPNVDFTVIFDGYSTEISFYSKIIKIFYSQDITADEMIRKILERKKNKKEIFVVSDDNEIKEFTKILGANQLKVPEFLEIIYPKKNIKMKEKDKEIDYTIKIKIEKELEKFYGEKTEKDSRKNL